MDAQPARSGEAVVTLQHAINWTRPFLKNQPLDFDNMEPALETGNLILQTIFGAPLVWRFNRGTFSFPTAAPAAIQLPECDYTLSLPDFGFLETQWILDKDNKSYALGGALTLPRAASQSTSRPTHLAAQYDDGQGNITFRTKQMPNAAYTVMGDYQRRAARLYSLAQPLAPLPEEMGYVFNLGFLAITSLLVNDARSDYWEKKFIARLLGLQDGLDAVRTNIFMGHWESVMKTAARSQAQVSTGTQARMGE
jgi:hypothetical protein